MNFHRFTLLSLSLILSLFSTSNAIEQTVNVSIPKGWSAVWLNVDPIETSGADIGQNRAVADVFNDPAIDIIARPSLPVGSAEFISDSSSGTFNGDDAWLVWRRTSELAANTLTRVRGNTAYLIHSTADINLDITGTASFFRPTWVPASYNLLGFTSSGQITFGEFFKASNGNHLPSRIFRLLPDGEWSSVSATDTMGENEAFWIYSERSSSYMGPVAIDLGGSSSLTFGDTSINAIVPDPQGNPGDTLSLSTGELTFSNVATDAGHSVEIEKSSPATSGGDATSDSLRLFHLVPQPDSLDYAISSGGQITSWSVATLAAKSTTSVTVGADHNWSTAPYEEENLYEINVSIGSNGGTQSFWLPVSATLGTAPPSPLGQPDPGTAGLWIGEILIDHATSATEPGNPLRPTTSRAPLTILLHADASGAVSLLGHVTLMQTKTADPSVVPDEVLVINDEKIPFFEGVENPDGSRSGRRFEAAAFDLPRKLDLTTQLNLSELVFSTTGGDTLAHFLTYLGSQDSRPPSLIEDYHTSWPLQGGLEIGASVSTASPLHIDPFHRANPFRHAFHPSHAAGPSITRSFDITIASQTAPGQLTGTFQETLTGLTAFDISASGTLTLHRISSTAALQ